MLAPPIFIELVISSKGIPGSQDKNWAFWMYTDVVYKGEPELSYRFVYQQIKYFLSLTQNYMVNRFIYQVRETSCSAFSSMRS